MFQATPSLPRTRLFSGLHEPFPESSLPSTPGLHHIPPVQEYMAEPPLPFSTISPLEIPNLWLCSCVCSDDLKHLSPGISHRPGPPSEADGCPLAAGLSTNQETERISAQGSHLLRLPRGARKGRVTRTSKRKPVFGEECVNPHGTRVRKGTGPQPRALHAPAPLPSSTLQSWRWQRVPLPRAQRLESGPR